MPNLLKNKFCFLICLQIVFALSLHWPLVTQAQQPIPNRLRPFHTDGCSMAADSLPGGGNWLTCCVQHDVEYWLGGSEADKENADQQLDLCVTRNSTSFLGKVFHNAVSVGGSAYLPTTWRWGYGWTQNREYFLRTTDEQNLVDRLLQQMQVNILEGSEPKDFATDILSCQDSDEQIQLELKFYKHTQAQGFIKYSATRAEAIENSTVLSGEALLAEAISQWQLGGSGVEAVYITSATNTDNFFGLNLIENSSCELKKTKERFSLTGILLKTTKTSTLFTALKGKKFCCEKLKNSL